MTIDGLLIDQLEEARAQTHPASNSLSAMADLRVEPLKKRHERNAPILTNRPAKSVPPLNEHLEDRRQAFVSITPGCRCAARQARSAASRWGFQTDSAADGTQAGIQARPPPPEV